MEQDSLHVVLPFLIGVIVLIILVQMLARKIKVAYPILVVIAGLLVSTIPSVPTIRLNPDWVFFIFLPPLLFEASWSISQKEMRKWWRMISSFSFLVVFFTATCVAIFTNYLIPGFSLALGFLLGGIVSPPDAVSANAILKFVKIPKSTATILEGESLFNDASSLIIFRFALVAIGTGQFIWQEAIVDFGWMVFGGAGIGWIIGWVLAQAHKRLPTDAPSDIVFTLLAPYILYWVAEQFHCSGVMAVVIGGLYLSSRRLSIFNSEGRTKGYSFWESFVFILNGLVFFAIGLDLQEVVDGLQRVGIPISTGVYYGVMVTVCVIFIRIVSSYLAMLSTLLFRRSVIRQNFSWKRALKIPLVMGWTGMRGVVSLAAACSIPLYLDSGEPFPQRELIMFISFMVIILTLFVQGLTLPIILKKVQLNATVNVDGDEHASMRRLRRELWKYSIDYVNEKHQHHVTNNLFFASMLASWQKKLEAADEDLLNEDSKTIYLELLEAQRHFLLEKNKDPNLDEDVVRRQLYLIDLEEERIRAI